jgi:hypothetical protein
VSDLLRDRVQAIQKLAEAATEGPWRWNPNKHHRESDGTYEEGVFAGPPGQAATNVAVTGPSDMPQAMADAAFIAAARTEVPWLSAALLEALDTIDKAREGVPLRVV